MRKINEAVLHGKDNLMHVQVAYRAFQHSIQNLNRDDQELQSAIAKVHAALAIKVSDAWERLAWLSPVSKDVEELLKKRTTDWFLRQDTEIMSWLGETGSYMTEDKEKFQAELKAALKI